MRLEDLSRPLVERAIAIFLAAAWPGREKEKMPHLGEAPGGEALVAEFTDESAVDGDRVSRKYVIRIGNRFYPHMKFALEEHLLENEFFFCVDTHDDLDLKPDFPDYEAWQQLKAENRRLKDEIESRWREAAVPTFADLARMLAENAPDRPKCLKNRRILIVDDQRDIADSVASILLAEGFDVLLAHDGEEAVETAIRERPDLILMDYQMPRLDGVQAAIRIRETLPKGQCRILLATAALMDLSTVAEADGFLLKPYSREILISFIGALLSL